jgi:hypothetical protein
MRDDSPEAVARRAADAERKRKSRAAEKLAKETAASADELKAVETIHDFWAVSRKSLDAGKFTEWKEVRQEEILGTVHWMNAVMDGTYNVSPDDTECYVGVEEGDEDIKRMLREYGEAGITPVLLLGKFWTDPELLAQLTKDEKPTAIFAKFGILVALPDLKVHQWEQFISAHRRKTQPHIEAPVFYVEMQCACDTPITSRESVPVSIAKVYEEKGIPWLCSRCRSKETSARTQANKAMTADLLRNSEHAVFDGWGRVKDQ